MDGDREFDVGAWLEKYAEAHVAILESLFPLAKEQKLAEAAFAVGFYVGQTYSKPEPKPNVETSAKHSKRGNRKASEPRGIRQAAKGRGKRKRA